ncbi:MAG: PorV/PorQ family protein [Gemmatimonadetes bacterium]|nr:PorV/PorQ family protein [Gemmatimonadota bacterium]
MSRYPALLALVLLPLVTAPALGQTSGTTLSPTDETEATRVATRGANFLSLPVGARAQALGGAYTAIASGVSALYWNTAAIAFDERIRIGGSLSNLYDDLDVQHIFAGFILPVGFNRFAVSLNQLSSGDIVRTDFEFPEGGNPQFGETFEWSATAVGLHYARLVTDRLAVGVAGKFINEGIPGADADFFAGDIGVQFETGILATRLAAAFFNLGSDSHVDGALVRRRVEQSSLVERTGTLDTRRTLDIGLLTNEVELPTGFRFGIATDLVGRAEALLGPSGMHRFQAMLDVADGTDTPLSPTVGLEYSFRDILYLRGGKRWANEEQISRDFSHLLSFGGGLAVPLPGGRRLMFDYAFTDAGDLQNVQSFALELAF